MKLVFAAILALLIGTAMSASFLHKEIEIGHNGVHYRVAVDAEKDQHGITHSLAGHEQDSSEDEHQNDVGNIGINYEVPDHLHHEDEKHHGVVIHIDLGGVHDSEDEHLHLPHHNTEEHHQEEHLGTESHGLKHHVHLESDQHDLEHEGWNPHDTEHHQIFNIDDLNRILQHHDSEENELEYGPSHHASSHLGDYLHLGHGSQLWRQKQNHILAHQKGNLHHLLASKSVTPIKVHTVVPYPPHVQLGHLYGQAYFQEQPFAEFDQLHHNVDIHH